MDANLNELGVSPEVYQSLTQQLLEGLDTQRSIVRIQRSHGGDICQAFSVTLDNQYKFFLKYRVCPPPNFFAREAEGLRWLGEHNAIRTPQVLTFFDRREFGFLALEWIDQAPPQPCFHRKLGQALAQLHQETDEDFGWRSDNYLGPILQKNTNCSSWSEFYAVQRLLPLVQELYHSASLPTKFVRNLETVIERLPDLIGSAEAPAKLHGDLWNGNILCDREQNVWLIDPAVYFGNREIDLAMLQLFGGYGSELFQKYDEVFPRQKGHEFRVALYQLYPLLVHVKLFGSSYLHQLNSALSKLLN